MDDTFLQDEGPTFDRATLEIKNENGELQNSQSTSFAHKYCILLRISSATLIVLFVVFTLLFMQA